jgi:RTX calcium-binding nonapeptide repeat (4 copies)
VVVGGALLTATPALAAATKVTWPITINVRAAPGTANRIQITYGPTPGQLALPADEDLRHWISDTAGITTVVTEPPSCYPEQPKLVSCPDGAPGYGESFSILLGDGDDLFTAELSVGEFAVNAGPGDDKVAGAAHPSVALQAEEPDTHYTEDMLYGGGGDDYLLAWRGPDFLSGGRGNDVLRGGYGTSEGLADDFGPSADTLLGGSGNDYLDATTHAFGPNPPQPERDHIIDCGRGKRDRARIDMIDPKPRGCESVKRVRHAADFVRGRVGRKRTTGLEPAGCAEDLP